VIKFICGCEYEIRKEDIGWWREVSTDREGFLVCVHHNERRYGWHSLPTDVRSTFPDYSFSAWTPLEIEKLIVWGELPKEPVYLLRPSETPDTRDNRDPEILGYEIMAKGNGK
jgi:hypothetical protein